MANKYQKWTQYQDQILIELVAKHGPTNWKAISNEMRFDHQIFNRLAKQCRERWLYHHTTTLNRQKWSNQECRQLLYFHALYGTKWVQIAKKLDGRTDNCVKNQFFALIKKGIRHMAKYANIRLPQINVYLVRPITISTIYLFSQNQLILQNNHTNEYLQHVSQYSIQQLFQITKCINHFSFKKLSSFQQSDNYPAAKIRTFITIIMDINNKIINKKEEMGLQNKKNNGLKCWNNIQKRSNSQQSATNNQQIIQDNLLKVQIHPIQQQLLDKQQYKYVQIEQQQVQFKQNDDDDDDDDEYQNQYIAQQEFKTQSQKIMKEYKITLTKIQHYRDLDLFFSGMVEYALPNVKDSIKFTYEQLDSNNPYENYDQIMNYIQFSSDQNQDNYYTSKSL